MKQADIGVLLVDDESGLLEAMSKLLELEGYRVGTAGSGWEALERCREGGWSIVFLDLNMPDLNGLDTYRRIRDINPEVPVVMITGYGRSLRQLVEEARQLGIRGCIDKPFKIQQIMEGVRAHVPHDA